MWSIWQGNSATRSKRGSRSLPAWLSSGTRQRTKRLWKGASEADTRIDDSSDGSPLTIEIGSDSPIGISPSTSPPGGGSRSLVAGDFNDDSEQVLAVANQSSDNVDV